MTALPQDPHDPHWIPFAVIGKPHGIKGCLFLRADDRRSEADDYPCLMIEHRNQRTIHEVRETFRSGSGVVVSLSGITSREIAEKLVNARVYCHRSFLDETEEDEFLVHDLVGLKVFCEGKGELGEIIAVVNFGAQENFEIRLGSRKETVYYPFIEPFVKKIDLENKRVEIEFVAELLEEG